MGYSAPMNTIGMELAALQGVMGGAVPFFLGLVVVLVLLGAFWLGMRVRRREPATPTPEEQPKLPEGGPVVEEIEMREADEMPTDGGCLTPHEMPASGNRSTRRAADQTPLKWNRNSSGGFGSGGPGHT
ncbi:hypothetical protein GCM10010358_34540 [Streptomyces minutiscleroticus]|uniref:Secreted protein n=2 Tax=Streptomyces minutiscleroticus TaxID=68238 RepID=A0A918KUA6_9ACTN|nr:hypothetical protein GCM10010358_34540 [Streptomyces minutiscleroticus]